MGIAASDIRDYRQRVDYANKRLVGCTSEAERLSLQLDLAIMEEKVCNAIDMHIETGPLVPHAYIGLLDNIHHIMKSEYGAQLKPKYPVLSWDREAIYY